MSSSLFPTIASIKKEIVRTPVFDTTVQRESSGRELRVSRMSSPRYRYSLEYTLREGSGGDEFRTLLNFFDTHQGSWDSFLFADPKGSAASTYAFGTGDGTTTVFYLKDEMGDRVGGNLAGAGNISIWKAGVLQTYTTHYSNDATTAKITFVTAPAAAAALTWSGTFYRRCRFDSDSLTMERIVSGYWKARVDLVSVLP